MSSMRDAIAADSDQIRAIYAPFCTLSSPVSFENEQPSLEEAENRLKLIQQAFPWLVLEENGGIIGYAHGAVYQARAAFAWDVSVSIYLAREYRGKKLSKKLYAELFSLLRKQGYFNAYATIALPNVEAVALHKSMGFVEVGNLPKGMHKGGKWYDIGLFWLQLQEYQDAPALPKKYLEMA